MTPICGSFIHYDVWKLLLRLAWSPTVLLQLKQMHTSIKGKLSVLIG